MKVSLTLVLGFLIFGVFPVRAQDKPDCSTNLDVNKPYNQLLLGCPHYLTPNNIAGSALETAQYGGPFPDLKQCKADLASWDQEAQAWLEREKARTKKGPPYNMHDNPRTEELLSIEELYRRSDEASKCDGVLIRQEEKLEHPSAAELMFIYYDSLKMEQFCASFRGELLDRAFNVLDKHLLLPEFRSEQGN
jgi:hypothetical protein